MIILKSGVYLNDQKWINKREFRHMSDTNNIIFDCPKCRQGIKAAANLAGEMAPCPNCGQDVKVPGTVANNGVVKSPLPLQPMLAAMPASQSGTTPLITRKSKGMAIAGLTLGIISVIPGFFCGGPIWAILGIIFSSVARHRISNKPDQYEGEGLAVAGLITSIVGLMLNLLSLFIIGFMGSTVTTMLDAFNKLPK